MLRTILILVAFIVFSGKVFAGDSSDVVWSNNTVHGCIGVSISPDNTMVAHMNSQGLINIHDFETGEIINTIWDSPATNTENHCRNGLDFSNDGKYLVGGKPFINKYDKWILGLTIWNTNDWSVYYSFDSLINPFNFTNVLSFFNNSNRLAVVIQYKIYIIDVDKKEIINIFDTGLGWSANQIQITQDDKYIILTGNYDKTDFAGGSTIIDSETGQIIKYPDGFPIKTLLTKDMSKIICFSKDDVWIRDFTNIYTYDLYKYDFKTVYDAKLSSDGQYVIATTGLGLYVFKVGDWDTPYKYDNMYCREYFDISSDGEYIATGDPTLLKPRWDLVSVDENIVEDFDFNIQISPNPADNNSKIKITSPETTQVEITISDINGNTMMTVFSGMLATGENTIPIDCVSLSSGMYFCNLIGENINQSVKFVVRK